MNFTLDTNFGVFTVVVVKATELRTVVIKFIGGKFHEIEICQYWK